MIRSVPPCAARILASDEIAQEKFEAQLEAHREKTARLRAERLARMEASWVERRKETIANIKSGLVQLQINTVLLKARRLSKELWAEVGDGIRR